MDSTSLDGRDDGRALRKIALVALAAHFALSAFSAFAFSTFLAGPPPDWLATPQNQRAMAFGFQYGGQTTVVLGAIAGLCYLGDRLGMRRATIVFAISFVLSLSSELAGTSTGFPFGVYGYSERLGYKIAGLVPFNIPTSWFYMLVASLAICGRLLRVSDDRASKWWWAFVAAFVLTAWDVSMDPAMVKTAHWLWNVPDLTARSAFEQFIGRPFFFGMPLTNWLGWLLTGIVVARAMLAIVPPTVWARAVSPSSLPLVLYGVNGLLPVAICFSQGMALAGVLGALAMLLPLTLAILAGRHAPARLERRPASRTMAVAGD